MRVSLSAKGKSFDNYGRNVQLLANRLYFVNDRSQLVEYDLAELKRGVELKKFYKGKIKSLSVVDFAVTNNEVIAAISENGTLELVNSEKSRDK